MTQLFSRRQRQRVSLIILLASMILLRSTSAATVEEIALMNRPDRQKDSGRRREERKAR